ncbi:hypothetical protein [Kribbella sindirgiensis]|uniref:Uncharacterized protein n=1 Tax=Kribbella sindirgiensis TaxID=1124744 RepID=A0A4R0I3N3_9ACTN|nr:hypothetical protein [Kribbella sindirgiensis]TCC19977.1 hypothetical protein E0H50_37775 [Kribbella sindirgiensis]
MSSPFNKPSGGSGSFFTPAKHVSDLALIIEAKSVRRDVPNTFNGVTTNRDEVTADITVFRNSQNIETRTPHEVMKNAIIHSSVLAKEAETNIGTPLLAKVAKPSGKNYYAFLEVPADIEAAVAEYFEKRESALADAMADVPDFD